MRARRRGRKCRTTPWIERTATTLPTERACKILGAGFHRHAGLRQLHRQPHPPNRLWPVLAPSAGPRRTRARTSPPGFCMLSLSLRTSSRSSRPGWPTRGPVCSRRAWRRGTGGWAWRTSGSVPPVAAVAVLAPVVLTAMVLGAAAVLLARRLLPSSAIAVAPGFFILSALVASRLLIPSILVASIALARVGRPAWAEEPIEEPLSFPRILTTGY